MLIIQEEKECIYQLMRELTAERGDISKQYSELKQRLDELNSIEQSPDKVSSGDKKVISVFEQEKIKSKDYLLKK
jgi:hypothetical protein